MNESHTYKVAKRIGILILIAGAFFAGMSLASYRSVHAYLTEEGQVDITKVIDLYSKTRSPEVSFDQYWEVWDTIKKRHVSQSANDVELFYSSLKGLVSGLDDPYSEYFPPTDAKEFTQNLEGEFGGIGAQIGKRDDQLVVIAPLAKTPAERAGLAPGDIILKINNEDTYGLSLEEGVSKIRGEAGTKVTLSILKEKAEASKDVEITREVINIPSVIHEMKEGNIAYLQITNFSNKTVKEFDEAVKDILTKSPKGIILDMRRNPGGYLDASVIVASEWIPEGPIVRERFVDNKVLEHKSTGSHKFANIKTVVLVDEGTASGAEIVAGALQDYGAATIVGTKTFGKGTVQDFEFLKDGSALKLTIAKWFTPKDHGIDKQGITPDIIVEDMFELPPEGQTGTIKDKGIEKALEILKQ